MKKIHSSSCLIHPSSFILHPLCLSLVRRAVDVLFCQYAPYRVNRLNNRSAAATQRGCLSRLVRQAQETRFGRKHGFASIRTVRQYQERVPLRDYEAFWKEYWQPAFPHLIDVTWPGQIPYFALSSGTTTGTTKYVPISRQMLASNRKAALTTLAFFLACASGCPSLQRPVFLSRRQHQSRETDRQRLRRRSQRHCGQGSIPFSATIHIPAARSCLAARLGAEDATAGGEKYPFAHQRRERHPFLAAGAL